MITRRFVSRGHLIDSGILASILNLIVKEEAGYEIVKFEIGKTNANPSQLELDVTCGTSEQLAAVTLKLVQIGCYEKKATEALLKPAPGDCCAPEDFYSTTNHKTEVFHQGAWRPVAGQRMDAVIVIDGGKGARCSKLRDVRPGDLVVCSSESVRVFPPERDRIENDLFGFMANSVSSERSVNVAVAALAEELIRQRKSGGKVVAVVGPVVVHTGGADALGTLVREGYIHGLLSGNALAVHDLEYQFYGTSLGIDLKTGKSMSEGHKNHMKAINRICGHGSIKTAMESGDLTQGIMFETIRKGIPYCLAGSIRDDGPLPETETDMIKAQEAYAAVLEGATLVLMLASMLHSIGTGNMLPSWVRTVCIDINPAVVTKLSDRGSSQATGIVSDVGLFLRALAQKLSE
ncbi:MAG: TIGR00300 family protein [Spirochaetales bacterium]|nr:MAG: TIGR00300 family protein [Spirochaetales bacterium]